MLNNSRQGAQAGDRGGIGQLKSRKASSPHYLRTASRGQNGALMLRVCQQKKQRPEAISCRERLPAVAV